jgi:hypothetical protein
VPACLGGGVGYQHRRREGRGRGGRGAGKVPGCHQRPCSFGKKRRTPSHPRHCVRMFAVKERKRGDALACRAQEAKAPSWAVQCTMHIHLAPPKKSRIKSQTMSVLLLSQTSEKSVTREGACIFGFLLWLCTHRRRRWSGRARPGGGRRGAPRARGPASPPGCTRPGGGEREEEEEGVVGCEFIFFFSLAAFSLCHREMPRRDTFVRSDAPRLASRRTLRARRHPSDVPNEGFLTDVAKNSQRSDARAAACACFRHDNLGHKKKATTHIDGEFIPLTISLQLIRNGERLRAAEGDEAASAAGVGAGRASRRSAPAEHTDRGDAVLRGRRDGNCCWFFVWKGQWLCVDINRRSKKMICKSFVFF